MLPSFRHRRRTLRGARHLFVELLNRFSSWIIDMLLYQLPIVKFLNLRVSLLSRNFS